VRKHHEFAYSLRDEPFFRAMNEGLLARIQSYVHHRAFDRGQIIFFPEDACDGVYWVREGRVKVTRPLGDGRKLSLRHLFPGDMLGEECLVNRPERGAYAEAMTPAVLCVMQAGDFRRMSREEPELSMRVAQRLCQRVTECEEVLAATVYKPVRSRIASGLLRMQARSVHPEDATVHVTHQELANLVGSTRETTTAVLHGLREEDIVSLANRQVTVLDLDALAQAAGGR